MLIATTSKYKIQATLCGYLASAINLGKESSRKLGMDYMTLLFNNFGDFKTNLGCFSGVGSKLLSVLNLNVLIKFDSLWCQFI